MNDLHTHILPQMDDGANQVEMSLQMLRWEHLQGVLSVALTPHYYRKDESIDEFLLRRDASYQKLCEGISALSAEERAQIPKLLLGAEVEWRPNVQNWEGIERLCYEGTSCILIEPPFYDWTDKFFSDLFDLMNTFGLTPVIAHIDRYFDIAPKKYLQRIYEMSIPVQISAESFLQAKTRRRALDAVKRGNAQLLISDCHDTFERIPNTALAKEVIAKRLGEPMVHRISKNTQYLLKI